MSKYNLLLSVILLTSCGGQGDTKSEAPIVPPPNVCSIHEQNQFLYNMLKGSYFWYQDVPNLDPLSFDSPHALLENVKDVIPIDRFSTISADYKSTISSGQYEGFGLGWKVNDAHTAMIIDVVFEDSSAKRAGLKRSDKVSEIDGVAISELYANGEPLNILPNTEHTLSLINAVLGKSQVVIKKDKININTIMANNVFSYEGIIVGYIAISSFIHSKTDGFTRAFDAFAKQGVEQVVIDLRYNSGGSIDAAYHLASLLGGEYTANKSMSRHIHNDKFSASDKDYSFSDLNVSGYDKISIIVSEQTCSASELVVNVLEPYIDVKLIGAATCGKPFGFYGKDFCGNTFLPIQFKIANSLGFGDYNDGIEVDCDTDDDYSKALGNPEERMLKTALQYSVSGRCIIKNEQIDDQTNFRKNRKNQPSLMSFIK